MTVAQGATHEAIELLQANDVPLDITLRLNDPVTGDPVPNWDSVKVQFQATWRGTSLTLRTDDAPSQITKLAQVPAVTGDTAIVVSFTRGNLAEPIAGNHTVDVIDPLVPTVATADSILTYRYGPFRVKRTIPDGVLTGWSPEPSTAAGGVLSGSYPDPSFAVDMATQAELNAAVVSFNVKTYGAVGNGVTDDSAAVQDAIDAAQAVGGSVGFFGGRAAVYFLGGQVHITAPVSLIGDATIKSDALTVGTTDTTGLGVVDALDVTGITVRGLKFDTDDNFAFVTRGCSNVLVTDCEFVSAGTTAVANLSFARSPNVTQWGNIRVIGNHFKPQHDGVLVIGYTSAHPRGIVVSGNTVDCANVAVTGSAGIKLDRYCEDFVVDGNTVRGNGNTFIFRGICIEDGSRDGVVSNNAVSGIVGRSISLLAGQEAVGITNVLVTGNTVHDPQAAGAGYGIEIDATLGACADISIIGNQLRACSIGVRETHSNCTGTVIKDNVIRGCTSYGIETRSDLVLIRDNIVLSTATTFSVRIVSATTAAYVEGNHLMQATAGSTAIGIVAGTVIQWNNRKPIALDQPWNLTNVTTDRTMNADATSTAELADIVGTVVAALVRGPDFGV